MPRSITTMPRHPQRVIVRQAVRESVEAVANTFPVATYNAPAADAEVQTKVLIDGNGDVWTRHSFMVGVDRVDDPYAFVGEVVL
jgi:hypothetical protein